jgi:hypothetical protein
MTHNHNTYNTQWIPRKGISMTISLTTRVLIDHARRIPGLYNLPHQSTVVPHKGLSCTVVTGVIRAVLVWDHNGPVSCPYCNKRRQINTLQSLYVIEHCFYFGREKSLEQGGE